MQKNGFWLLLVGILLGWTLSVAVSSTESSRAFGGTVDQGGGGYTLATGGLRGGDGEALYLWDHNRMKLAVYVVGDQGGLDLYAVRNCWFDLAIPEEFSLHETGKPSVGAMREKLNQLRSK